jgi:3-oxoacyl-[acyl-carrier-protein] synthase II
LDFFGVILHDLMQLQKFKRIVDYVNVHGTGTHYNDIMETMALKKVFGRKVLATTIKPLIGHTLGACGAFETLACIISLIKGFIPQIYCKDLVVDNNLDGVNYCFNETKYMRLDYILNNNVGFWGTNSSLLLKRWE